MNHDVHTWEAREFEEVMLLHVIESIVVLYVTLLSLPRKCRVRWKGQEIFDREGPLIQLIYVMWILPMPYIRMLYVFKSYKRVDQHAHRILRIRIWHLAPINFIDNSFLRSKVVKPFPSPFNILCGYG